jgi:hypothetical protein
VPRKPTRRRRKTRRPTTRSLLKSRSRFYWIMVEGPSSARAFSFAA